MYENTLDMLRGQIDNSDAEIMILLKRRFQTVKKVAEYKLKNDVEIFQSAREIALLKDKASKAITMGMKDSFVRELFEIILEESRRQQELVVLKAKNK